MNAYGVDVLHVADSNGVVRCISHDLELDLLVALYTLLYQDLMYRRKLQSVLQKLQELFLVVGKAAAGTAQGEGRSQYHRIADILCCPDAFLHAGGDLGTDHRLSQALAELLEELTVLGLFDALEGGSQDLHLALLQNALLGQLYRHVQTGLSAQSRNDGVRTLHTDDLCHVLQGKGLHVDLIRDLCISHNRCRI